MQCILLAFTAIPNVGVVPGPALVRP